MEESITKSVNDLDAWIEKLYNCKALTESEIKQLCGKVILYVFVFISLVMFWFILFDIVIGKGSFNGGVECTTCAMPCYYLW